MTTLKPPKPHVIWGYIGLGVAWFAFMVVVPLVVMIVISGYDWRSVQVNHFVGLQNYTDLFKDRIFKTAVKNNFLIILYCMIGQVGLGFLVSLMVNSNFLYVRKFHRVAIFLPVTLSSVVVGFTWVIIYNRDFGLLNALLTSVGLESWIKPWLDDPKGVVLAVSIPLIWQYIGYNMVIFLAGLQGISKDVLEMAQLDGANTVQRVWHIILPLLKPTFLVVIMLCISGNMKIFDHIYVMTNGGPGSSSQVLALYAYKSSFQSVRYGYGAAISTATMIISLALVFLSRLLLSGRKEDG